ncbi:rCG65866 [Rattus norvegicus]|nr:rCG65866 [Rattus norvegicus]
MKRTDKRLLVKPNCSGKQQCFGDESIMRRPPRIAEQRSTASSSLEVKGLQLNMADDNSSHPGAITTSSSTMKARRSMQKRVQKDFVLTDWYCCLTIINRTAPTRFLTKAINLFVTQEPKTKNKKIINNGPAVAECRHQEDQVKLFDEQSKQFHDFKHSRQSKISNTVVSPNSNTVVSLKFKNETKAKRTLNNTTENKPDKRDQDKASYNQFSQMPGTFSTWPKLQLNLSCFWDEMDHLIPPPNRILECPLVLTSVQWSTIKDKGVITVCPMAKKKNTKHRNRTQTADTKEHSVSFVPENHSQVLLTAHSQALPTVLCPWNVFQGLQPAGPGASPASAARGSSQTTKAAALMVFGDKRIFGGDPSGPTFGASSRMQLIPDPCTPGSHKTEVLALGGMSGVEKGNKIDKPDKKEIYPDLQTDLLLSGPQPPYPPTLAPHPAVMPQSVRIAVSSVHIQHSSSLRQESAYVKVFFSVWGCGYVYQSVCLYIHIIIGSHGSTVEGLSTVLSTLSSSPPL